MLVLGDERGARRRGGVQKPGLGSLGPPPHIPSTGSAGTWSPQGSSPGQDDRNPEAPVPPHRWPAQATLTRAPALTPWILAPMTSNGDPAVAPGEEPATAAPAAHRFSAMPYEPYDIQLGFMQTLYDTLEAGGVALLESPTGSAPRPVRPHASKGLPGFAPALVTYPACWLSSDHVPWTTCRAPWHGMGVVSGGGWASRPRLCPNRAATVVLPWMGVRRHRQDHQHHLLGVAVADRLQVKAARGGSGGSGRWVHVYAFPGGDCQGPPPPGSHTHNSDDLRVWLRQLEVHTSREVSALSLQWRTVGRGL